jgi:hypothetical protein
MLSDATATTSDPQNYGWGNGRRATGPENPIQHAKPFSRVPRAGDPLFGFFL